MPGQVLTVVIGIAMTLTALVTLLVLGWRAKSRLVLGLVVQPSKRFMNRRQLRTAGRPGAYAGIIRHVGRRSGTAYETPIGIVADGDSFLVALPYGRGTSWVRNVLAAARATLVHEGETIAVDRPELVPMSGVADRFTPSDQRMFRLLRVDTALRLHHASEGELTPDLAA